MSFYTVQKTITGYNSGSFDKEVNELLYRIRNQLDVKISYNTVQNDHSNDPIHVAYITWRERVEENEQE